MYYNHFLKRTSCARRKNCTGPKTAWFFQHICQPEHYCINLHVSVISAVKYLMNSCTILIVITSWRHLNRQHAWLGYACMCIQIVCELKEICRRFAPCLLLYKRVGDVNFPVCHDDFPELNAWYRGEHVCMVAQSMDSARGPWIPWIPIHGLPAQSTDPYFGLRNP